METTPEEPDMSGLFSGRAVLIVDDEPLIALDLSAAFESAGAMALSTTSLKTALIFADANELAAAVIDYVMGDEKSDELCMRLSDRKVPFVIYSGAYEDKTVCHPDCHISKPERPEVIVARVEELITTQAAR